MGSKYMENGTKMMDTRNWGKIVFSAHTRIEEEESAPFSGVDIGPLADVDTLFFFECLFHIRNHIGDVLNWTISNLMLIAIRFPCFQLNSWRLSNLFAVYCRRSRSLSER